MPLGTLESNHYHELERAIRWWTSRSFSSSASNSNNYSTGSNNKSVLFSFELLDRLEEELLYLLTLEDHSPDVDAAVDAALDIMTSETISLLVNLWRLSLRQHHQHQQLYPGEKYDNPNNKTISTDDHSYHSYLYYSPEEVLEKVESYSASIGTGSFRYHASGSVVTAQIYTMILDGMYQYYLDLPLASKIQGLLDRMEQVHHPPTDVTYTTAIHALTKTGDGQDRRLALQLLKSIQDHDTSNQQSQPQQSTVEAYGAMIGSLAKSVRSYDTLQDRVQVAQQAEDLLKEMLQLTSDKSLQPISNSKVVVYQHALHAWAQTLAEDAGERAEVLLKTMVEDTTCQPNQYCYSAVMTAYAKCGKVQPIERLLQELQILYDQHDNSEDYFPNVFCFNALIEAWSNHSSPQSTRQAEAVLQRMEEYALQTGKDACLPNLVSFNLVLRTHAEHGSQHRQESADRAIRILEHMKQDIDGLEPDTISYNCVLQCLANSSTRQSQQYSKQAQYFVETEMPRPDVVSYANVIRAWAAAGDAEQAERFLRSTCQSIGRVQPDVSCFNAVMTAWSKTKSPSAGQRAEALLRFMTLDQNIRPDIVTFNAIMDCWCSMASHRHSPQSAERALSILRHVQKQEAKIEPNAISYTTCIWAFAAAKLPQQAEELFAEMKQLSVHNPSVTPNLYTYCALISAWGKVGHPIRAQAIFDSLVARAQEDLSLRPNTAVYSALLHAWSKAGDVAKSVSILQSMCDDYENDKDVLAIPDERCFSAVINALSRSKHPDAAPQAESCLKKMQEMADNGIEHVRPNVFTYQSVISAWANSDLPVAAEQAEANLQHLKDLYYKHGDSRCRPNVIAYTNTLRAWLRASAGGYVSSKQAVERSEALLDEMLNSDIPEVQPNRITFGTVLRTIAESRLSDKLSRAKRIGRIMNDHGVELDAFTMEQMRKAQS